MQNTLQIFKYEDTSKIRAVKHDDDSVWFVANDVARSLGYKNLNDAISKHVDKEDKTVSRIATPSRGMQSTTMINESGLYSLIFASQLSNAKKFKHWVTSEVLPQIRKTGAYVSQALLDRIETLERENKELRDQFEKLLPATTTGLLLLGSKHDYTIQEAMQILAQHGFKIGQNSGYARLRAKKWLCNRKGKQWNHPTQYAIENGYFHIMTDWKNRISIMITPKALAKLADELTQEQMPVIYLIERDEPKPTHLYLK